MKNGNAVYDLLLPSSAKIFPRSVHLSPSFTSRLADDPARRLPRLFFHCLSAFPFPRLVVLGVALSVCRSLISRATSYRYRSAHVGEKEIILVNFLFALMLMQLWWNQKLEWVAFSLIFFFKHRTTDTDTSYCFRAPMSRTVHFVPFFPLGDYNGQHTDKSTHSYNCKMLWRPQKYSTLWDAEGHCGSLQIIKDKPWWSEQDALS